MKKIKILTIVIVSILFSCQTPSKSGLQSQTQEKTFDWRQRDFKYMKRVLANPRTLSGKEKKAGEIFDDKQLEKDFFKNYKYDKAMEHISKVDYYHKKKLNNSTYMQGSGPKRLYDVNIILRGIYQNRIVHKKTGPLGKKFANALFVDIGSAILFMKGATTVRDIYEDDILRKNLRMILATDINEYKKPAFQYVNIYREQKKPFPFPVQEIPKSITRLNQVDWLITRNTDSMTQPVIMRSINSGPDRFYFGSELRQHLKAVIAANIDREFIYFFRTYILYKPAGYNRFQIIARMDPVPWVRYHWYTSFDWDNKRLLKQSIHKYQKHLRLVHPNQPTGSKAYKP